VTSIPAVPSPARATISRSTIALILFGVALFVCYGTFAYNLCSPSVGPGKSLASTVVSRWHFRQNLAGYQAIAKLVEDGKLKPTSRGLALLPPDERGLARCTGTVDVNTADGVTRIYFNDYDGMHDVLARQMLAGWVYRSDDQPPVRSDFTAWGPITVERLEPHWYYVEH
jgi:hypothetical protein